MNLIRKGHEHSHRGVIGIESAIVLIAFVIVAAALAFVVLNMGFATTQKAKTSIVATLGEAGSSLEVQGKVFAWSDTTDVDVEVLAIPIKIASGGDSVNLDNNFTAVKFVSNDVTYDDIYEGIVTGGPYNDIDTASDQGVIDFAASNPTEPLLCDVNPIAGGAGGANPTNTCAFIYFTVDNNGNDILDAGEHAVLAVLFDDTDDPTPLDKIKVELIPPTGATMTVERSIPNLSTAFVDLG